MEYMILTNHLYILNDENKGKDKTNSNPKTSYSKTTKCNIHQA